MKMYFIVNVCNTNEHYKFIIYFNERMQYRHCSVAPTKWRFHQIILENLIIIYCFRLISGGILSFVIYNILTRSVLLKRLGDHKICLRIFEIIFVSELRLETTTSSSSNVHTRIRDCRTIVIMNNDCCYFCRLSFIFSII